MKNLKISVKITLIILIVLGLGFLVLGAAVSMSAAQMVNDQITNQMTDAVESRATVIDSYVSSAEEYLVAFSLSDEVREVLRTEGDKDALKRAQQYTVDFADAKGVFEGLYIASPETYVYTHTSEGAIGMTTRPGDALKPFQEQIFVEGKLTNLGIMKSPGSGNMVISMYYPVFENGQCIGYVGAAVLASHLMDSLDNLPISGLPDCQYVFLNIETGEYLYNEDPDLLCTVTEDPEYLKILDELKNETDAVVGIESYIDEEASNSLKDEEIIVYRSMPERNWVFMVKDTRAHVFSKLETLQRTTRLVCVVVAIVVMIVLALVLMRLGNQLNFITSQIEKLGNMDLSVDKKLKAYEGQKDEVGIICDTLVKTCNNLNAYIGEVGTQLNYMASGDFTHSSDMKFEGAFEKLNQYMDEIQHALRDSFIEIRSVTNELVIGAQSVADTSSSLASAANESSSLLHEIDAHLTGVTQGVATSAELAQQAREESVNASSLVQTSAEKMTDLSVALSQIAEASNAIEKISNSLEAIAKQTNILALNALVEANRAGDAGDGFAVVANEIRQLAEKSSEAANDSYRIIKETVSRIEEGMRIGQEASDCLDQVVSQTEIIDSSVSQIADATSVQNEQLNAIRGRLHEIDKAVEMTAAMSEQSASASVELDGQTRVLNENIGRYYV